MTTSSTNPPTQSTATPSITLPSTVQLLKEIREGSESSTPSGFVKLGSKLFFTANDGKTGTELWVSDGTAAGTTRVKDINSGANGSDPANLTALGDKLFFRANDGQNGTELWVSDGTEKGTTRVKDINGGANGSEPSYLTVLGDKLFFKATDSQNGSELWVSDGTEAGTIRVKDINSGPHDSEPSYLTVLGNKLFFNAYDGQNGTELWVSNGTEAGTTLVKNISADLLSSNPYLLTPVGDKLFFVAHDENEELGYELRVSNGTEAGTTLVKDIKPGFYSGNPLHLTAFGNKLFFNADDGQNGTELWVSDGTNAGTTLFKNINGDYASDPSNLTVVGNKLFFSAHDEKNGEGLWVSDGTATGTSLVKDINSGAGQGSLSSLTAVGDKLFFSANDRQNGQELWVSDGTAANTALVKDINSGIGDSSPQYFTALGDKLFFQANDGKTGTELWVYQAGAPTQQGKTVVFSAANNNAISVNYADANAELTVTLSTSKDAATLSAKGDKVSDNASHTLTLTGKLADIQAALAEVTYQPAANTVGKQALTVTVKVGGQETSSTLPIEITPPAIKLPNDKTLNFGREDTALVFSTATKNAIAIEGADASLALSLVLTVPDGKGTLKTKNDKVSGNDSKVLTLTGTAAEINAILADISYQPAANQHGTIDIALALTAGGLTTTTLLPISLTAVADTPTITQTSANANRVHVQRNPADGTEATFIKITDIKGGKLYQQDGITEINNGSFISFDNVAHGLRFTPEGKQKGSFEVQAATGAVDDLLGGDKVKVDVPVLEPGFNPATSVKLGIGPQLIDHFIYEQKLYLAVTDFKAKKLIGGTSNGDGSFTWGSEDSSLSFDYLLGDFHADDLNGDKRPELIATNQSKNLIVVSDQTIQLDSTATPGHIISTHFNGDSHKDLVVANTGNKTLALIANLGMDDEGRNFKLDLPKIINLSGNPESIAASDVNNDGAVDLLVAQDDNKLAVWLNNPGKKGEFTAAKSYELAATPGIPKAIVAVDLNGDGKVDVVSTIGDSNKLTVLLNNGDGTFRQGHDFATGTAPYSLISDDFNGDGKADLATANQKSHDVSVLLGKGDGSFALKQDYAAGLGTIDVRSVDVNGDGKPDLVTANSTDDGKHGSVSVLINTYPSAPTPTPTPAPAPTPAPRPIADKDGVPDAVEHKVPVLLPVGSGKAIEGDGNGDGHADSQQSNVSSVAFLHTHTAQTKPGDAKPVYVTLVSDAKEGKTGAAATAALSEVKQLDKPADAPADLSMPLGLIAFKADAGSAGASKNFSLYVDSSVSVNGYWKKVGKDWVNLASQEFGGKLVTEGGKIRLDFTIVDGGKFDDDGKKDGVITDPGAIGFRAGSSSDSDNDQFPDALEAANGLKVGVKDNAVMSNSKFFVMQLYRDVLSREADTGGLAVWQKQLDDGLMNRAQITHAFMNSAEFQSEAGAISRLYLGTLGKQAEKAELDSQVELLRSGKNLSQLASDFIARSDVASQYAGKDNTAFVEQMYTQVLGRQGEAAGVQAWKGMLDGGMARSQVLLGFTESAEFKALSDQRVKLGMDYLYLLERTPDATGYANWLGMTQQLSAVEIIGHFINSPEYQARFIG